MNVLIISSSEGITLSLVKCLGLLKAILLAQGYQIPENLKKEVDSKEPKYVAYPWPNNFIKGLISGKYHWQSIRNLKTDLAWQSLFDPLPNLYEKVWSRLGIIHIYDGIMLEKLLK